MVLGFYCEIYCFVDLERARNLAAFYHTAPKKKSFLLKISLLNVIKIGSFLLEYVYIYSKEILYERELNNGQKKVTKREQELPIIKLLIRKFASV